MKTLMYCFVLASVVMASLAWAAVPQQLNYQGYLTNPSGSPLDTTVAMTFKLYTDSLAGSLLWTETRPSVTVTDGLFNVRLGQITSLGDAVFNNAQVWLGITVGNNSEMTPRSRIVSVGYSYRVGTVDGASGGTISSDVNVSGRANIGSGNANPGVRAFVVGENGIAIGNWSTIGGGYNNRARGAYSVVSGGGGADPADSNSAVGHYSAIGGGYRNIATGYSSIIGGGAYNGASGSFGTVGGGNSNTASGFGSAIAGGVSNQATAQGAFVGCGQGNLASGNWATVGGGVGNVVAGQEAVIAGGCYDTIMVGGQSCAIGGGQYNVADGWAATIAGGLYNKALFQGAAVGGGRYNYARALFSNIAGGGGLSITDSNSVRGQASSIGGGSGNSISSEHAVISGGMSNDASGLRAVIGGGFDNTASGQDATIGGGYQNIASGSSTTIPGGVSNEATEFATTAMGFRAKARHIGAFVWADRTYSDFASDSSNTFNARATGGVRFYTNSALTAGVKLYSGASSWTSVSDSTKKQNIRPVDTREVLDRVAQLPIKQWSYKSQDPSIEHIGPMAQDFWKLFHLGEDSLGISTIDPDGIALAAIQELQKQNAELRKELNDLRRLVEQMAAKQNSNETKAASAAFTPKTHKLTLKEIGQ
ncbi:MAG: hypothetical protein FJY66_01815 [Calditrichaeota bacterium]|nr:hypothetical protein [Calditrichota bacterium]